MIIKIDKQTKIELLRAIKDGQLDTLKIPALYGDKLNFFEDLLKATNRTDGKTVGIPIEN